MASGAAHVLCQGELFVESEGGDGVGPDRSGGVGYGARSECEATNGVYVFRYMREGVSAGWYVW